jgi:hypothetical protein
MKRYKRILSLRQTGRRGFPAQTFLHLLLIPWLDFLFFGMPFGIFYSAINLWYGAVPGSTG